MSEEFNGKYLAEVLRRQAAVKGAKMALQQLNNPVIIGLISSDVVAVKKRQELIRRAEQILTRTTRS